MGEKFYRVIFSRRTNASVVLEINTILSECVRVYPSREFYARACVCLRIRTRHVLNTKSICSVILFYRLNVVRDVCHFVCDI